MCINHEWRLCKRTETQKFIDDIRPYMRIQYKIEQLDKAVEISKQSWNRRFKCRYCTKDYANPAGRRQHEKLNHSNSNASDQIDCETSKLRETP